LYEYRSLQIVAHQHSFLYILADICCKAAENCCIAGVKAKTLINESRQFTATMIGALPEGSD